jgi:hypothetical protein
MVSMSFDRFSCLIFATVFAAALSLGGQQIPTALSTDPPVDRSHPAAMDSFQIPSHGALLNAIAYLASGAGPHPVVIVLHGFPGNEKNLDSGAGDSEGRVECGVL